MADEKSGETSDARRDEAELIGRIIQSEQKLTDYFTTIITKSVTDQLDRRNMLRLRVIGLVVVALMTVAIPGTMSWVRGTIAEQTANVMTEQFEQSTAATEARFLAFLDQERAYSTFANYLLYLSEQATVRNSELTEVRVRLETLGAASEVRDRPGFPRTLDLLAKLAVQHGDRLTLDLLESEFGDYLTASRTQPRLARFYGERVLGDIFTSKAKRDSAARRFQGYVDASESNPDFEALLPLQAMVDSQVDIDQSEGTFDGIRAYVRGLGPIDQAVFIAETVRYSNPEFWEAPTTGQSRRISLVAGQLVLDHRDFYIHLLDSVSVQSALIDIAESEANKGNATFATALSGFRNAFSDELESTDSAVFRAAVDALIRSDIGLWMDDAVVIDAINQQNKETKDYSRARIQELEATWHDEFESGAHDLIENILERPISRHLRRVKRDGVGTYHELYVMDGMGLLVGASDPNSDYWQGEEDHWLRTYKVGAGSLHIGSLEFDDSALAWVIQVSMPILDSETGRPIGAWSAAIDPSMLEDVM
jgi:hypothetical protein